MIFTVPETDAAALAAVATEATARAGSDAALQAGKQPASANLTALDVPSSAFGRARLNDANDANARAAINAVDRRGDTMQGLLTLLGNLPIQRTAARLAVDGQSAYPNGISLFTYNGQAGWPNAIGSAIQGQVLTFKDTQFSATGLGFVFQLAMSRGRELPTENRPHLYLRWPLNAGADDWSAFHAVWTDGNDGIASGLDADLLDGLDSSGLATPTTIAARDSNGGLRAENLRPNSYTVATLPSASARGAGATVHCSNARTGRDTLGTSPQDAGNAGVGCLVTSDNTNWRTPSGLIASA